MHLHQGQATCSVCFHVPNTISVPWETHVAFPKGKPAANGSHHPSYKSILTCLFFSFLFFKVCHLKWHAFLVFLYLWNSRRHFNEILHTHSKHKHKPFCKVLRLYVNKEHTYIFSHKTQQNLIEAIKPRAPETSPETGGNAG